MNRSVASIAIFAGVLASAPGWTAAPSGIPATAEQTVERCKKSPELCKTLIRSASSRVIAAKEACIPKDIPQDAVADRVMRVLEDALEEDFGLKEVNYSLLAGQVIAFIWPCGVVS